MLTENINFKNFLIKSKNYNIKNIYKNMMRNYHNGQLKPLLCLSKDYKYSYDHKLIKKYKNYSNFRIIGMGGSILGSEAIYKFLKHKIKKKFFFLNNLDKKLFLSKKKRYSQHNYF